MQRWQTTLLMVTAGVGPATVVIVVLRLFELIDLSTALLLGLLYLLFISTNLWCRIFSKVPPTSTEAQVDSLPCYEEAVKSDPPTYEELFPQDPPSCDVTTSPTIAATDASPTSVKCVPTFAPTKPSHISPFNIPSVSFYSKSEGNKDCLPILEGLAESSRRNSRPTLLPAQVTGVHSPNTGASNLHSTVSQASSSVSTDRGERKTKKEKLYSRMLENIANPLDIV